MLGLARHMKMDDDLVPRALRFCPVMHSHSTPACGRARHLAAAGGRSRLRRAPRAHRAAIAASIRLIDTSPIYGDAERLLADALGATACRTTGKPTSADQAQHPRRLLNS
jgi:hypothetical protein